MEQASTRLDVVAETVEIYAIFFEKIKNIFEKQPILSKFAIMQRIGCYNERIVRTTLSNFAVYHNKGPFRFCWVVKGIEPECDRALRIFQSIDFRSKRIDATHRNNAHIFKDEIKLALFLCYFFMIAMVCFV